MAKAFSLWAFYLTLLWFARSRSHTLSTGGHFKPGPFVHWKYYRTFRKKILRNREGKLTVLPIYLTHRVTSSTVTLCMLSVNKLSFAIVNWTRVKIFLWKIFACRDGAVKRTETRQTWNHKDGGEERHKKITLHLFHALDRKETAWLTQQSGNW